MGDGFLGWPVLTSWSKTIALCNGVPLFKPSFLDNTFKWPKPASFYGTTLGYGKTPASWWQPKMGVQPGLQLSSLLPAIQPTAPATSLYLEFSSPTAGTNSRLTCTPVGWGFVQLCELSHCDPSSSDGSPRVNLGSTTQQASSRGMRDWSCFWGTVMLWMVVLELACLQPGLKGMSRLLQPTSPVAHKSNPRHAYSSAFMLAPGLAVLCTFSMWAMCVGSRIALS